MGVTLKALSVAALAGLAFGAPAFATGVNEQNPLQGRGQGEGSITLNTSQIGQTLNQVQGDTKVSVQNDKIFGSQGNSTNTLSHCERVEFLNERSEFRNSGDGLDRLPRLAARTDVQSTKTVLKQLTPAQKVALGARSQNTTRTTSAAVLRAL